ncbi:hypothetical protein I352_05506 [Cryptococcus deuterogattii MMRL2647]|nr:hypothetical protein I352_05506 [Cryptococcus deuterogattii MMRL2647]
MVNPAILAQDRYADYKSGLSDVPPPVAGKPSLRGVLDLPEYRSGPFPWNTWRIVEENDLCE